MIELSTEIFEKMAESLRKQSEEGGINVSTEADELRESFLKFFRAQTPEWQDNFMKFIPEENNVGDKQ